MSNRWKNTVTMIPPIFLAGRLILFLSLPAEGLRGYGDFWNFYRLGGAGLPFRDFWVEFPPVFPFLATGLYHLAGSRQYTFEILLAIGLSLTQAATLGLFLLLSNDLFSEAGTRRRGWFYFSLLIGLFYGWGYFDPIAVFMLLLGLYYLLKTKDRRSGLAFAVGALTKWFPILALASVWKYRPPKKAFAFSAIVAGIVFVVYAALMAVSPEMTGASILSQVKKGSWETVWALVDGHYSTGNFDSKVDRSDPDSIMEISPRPTRIPSWATLLVFGSLGLWIFMRTRCENDRHLLAFTGLTLCVFFLWSPGWSPQWVLYLLPFILLVLNERMAFLFGLSLVLINLLEWPVLLSRGLFWGLWITVPVRTFLIILLAIEFWAALPKGKNSSPVLISHQS